MITSSYLYLPNTISRCVAATAHNCQCCSTEVCSIPMDGINLLKSNVLNVKSNIKENLTDSATPVSMIETVESQHFSTESIQASIEDMRDKMNNGKACNIKLKKSTKSPWIKKRYILNESLSKKLPLQTFTYNSPVFHGNC